MSTTSPSTGRDRPTVGIVGAGQLARMMIEAATPLDIPIVLLAADPRDGAAQIWPFVELGQPKSASDLTRFAERCDVITFDHELVDLDAIRTIEATGKRAFPSPATLLHAQDKLHQRRRFSELGLPVPRFRAVATGPEIEAFAADCGWPVVCKAQRDGYDGRGVWVVHDASQAHALVLEASDNGVALLCEEFVPIERELAGLIARRPSGEHVLYPIAETVQRDGICTEVIAPAAISPGLHEQAAHLTRTVADAIDLVGIMALELFESAGRLLVNEIATRPHNSGHFTIEACQTSQFENHLRAILDWPLGPTTLRSPVAVMANLLAEGTQMPAPGRIALPAGQLAELSIHLYGKSSRPGRKIGHVTALGREREATSQRARLAARQLMSQTTDQAS